MIRQKIILEVSVMSEKPLDGEQKKVLLIGMINELSAIPDYINDVVDVDVIVPPTPEDVTGWSTSGN